MPVDLRALPEKLSPPQPPRHRRWCLVVLLCALIIGGLVILLWPDNRWRMSLWFWCCALVLPGMFGLVLYALRLLAHERRSEFVESWNQIYVEQEHMLIGQGQRTLALLATSYCSAAGSNQLAQALRVGSKPLQPVYLNATHETMRISQLTPSAQSHTRQEYAQRMGEYFAQVMRGLEPELQTYALNTPLHVRIRHNQVLSDEQVLSLWQACADAKQPTAQITFAHQDDGLLWIDAWLDAPATCELLLSIEANLFLNPIAEQAESVSAVLLAHADWCKEKNFAAEAVVHRPVQLIDQTQALADVFLWGGLQATEALYFTWDLQMPASLLCDATVALNDAGYPPDSEKRHQVHASLGAPGCAAGNVALIVASEGAKADREAQLVFMQDASPQVCVVQPA